MFNINFVSIIIYGLVYSIISALLVESRVWGGVIWAILLVIITESLIKNYKDEAKRDD